MSLFNALCGTTPGHDRLLLVLGQTPQTIARYRDCFINQQLELVVYTRIGGMNRNRYQNDIDAMREHPLFLRDYDDEFDSTFAYFVFRFPDKVPVTLLQSVYDATTAIVGTPRERFDMIIAKLRNPDKFKDDPEYKNALTVGQRILEPIQQALESNDTSNITIVVDKDGVVQSSQDKEDSQDKNGG